ncbi:hypothetical protein [Paracoccus actinidiae]|uniref:hypothetical protein n=1 Tax=Paracoccus actinidiae TaxID=3064531 RepID=UPI0027D2A421|nr:hypothetical protein [Paracoccus sp. M09]
MEHAEGLIAVLVPDVADDTCALRLRRLRDVFGDRTYLALTLRRRPNDQLRLHELSTMAAQLRVPTVVTNDVLYHEPSRRILQDVVTAKVFEAHRQIVLGASMIAVQGRVQREGEMVHFVVHRMEDLSRS